jgi:hypothetical protein
MYLGFSEVHILQGNLGRLANFFPHVFVFYVGWFSGFGVDVSLASQLVLDSLVYGFL